MAMFGCFHTARLNSIMRMVMAQVQYEYLRTQDTEMTAERQ